MYFKLSALLITTVEFPIGKYGGPAVAFRDHGGVASWRERLLVVCIRRPCVVERCNLTADSELDQPSRAFMLSLCVKVVSYANFG